MRPKPDQAAGHQLYVYFDDVRSSDSTRTAIGLTEILLSGGIESISLTSRHSAPCAYFKLVRTEMIHSDDGWLVTIDHSTLRWYWYSSVVYVETYTIGTCVCYKKLRLFEFVSRASLRVSLSR